MIHWHRGGGACLSASIDRESNVAGVLSAGRAVLHVMEHGVLSAGRDGVRCDSGRDDPEREAGRRVV